MSSDGPRNSRLRCAHLLWHRKRSWGEIAPRFLGRLLQELVFFLYPAGCAGCGELLDAPAGGDFCPGCRKSLELVSEPYCPVCGFPLAEEAPAHLCGGCLEGRYLFDTSRSAGIYQGLLLRLIHRFKYEGDVSLARPLAHLLISPATEILALYQVELVVPVPLHPRRLRERGFNQASLLAARLGKWMRLPVGYSVLERSRWTDPQTGLSRNQRAVNVRGAFSLNDCQSVPGKGILLVDDVFTTGATVSQCARVLRKGGAGKILVLTVARTV